MKVQFGTHVRFYSVYYAAALVGLFSAMLLSCELLQEDIFPASFGQELAVLDLGNLKRAAGVPDTAMVWEPWYVPVPQHNKQFLVVPLHQFSAPSALALLDARSLTLLKTFSNIPMGPFALLDMDGYLATGNGQTLVRINPVTLEVVEAPLVPNPPIDFARAGFTAQNEETPYTYLVGFDETGIKLQAFDSNWIAGSTGTKDKIFSEQPASQFVLQDLLYDGSRVFLALTDTMSQSSYILRWNSLQDFIDAFNNMEEAFLAFNADRVIKINLPEEKGLRLSTKGYFIRLHDKVEKLVRYDLEGDNRVLDSFVLPNNFRGRAGVFSDGSAWCLYDEQKNTLQLLRPWW